MPVLPAVLIHGSIGDHASLSAICSVIHELLRHTTVKTTRSSVSVAIVEPHGDNGKSSQQATSAPTPRDPHVGIVRIYRPALASDRRPICFAVGSQAPPVFCLRVLCFPEAPSSWFPFASFRTDSVQVHRADARVSSMLERGRAVILTCLGAARSSLDGAKRRRLCLLGDSSYWYSKVILSYFHYR